MKNLLDEVKTVLLAQAYPVTVQSIRPSYSKLTPAYPMVIIDEVNNTTRLAVNGEEILSDITYQIDIFSKDMIVGGVPTAGSSVCKGIGAVVDETLNRVFGMTRTSTVEIPDVNDATVSRRTLRYTGILDITTDYMYR